MDLGTLRKSCFVGLGDACLSWSVRNCLSDLDGFFDKVDEILVESMDSEELLFVR